MSPEWMVLTPGISIVCCADAGHIASWRISAALAMFRAAEEQQRALASIASEPKGCVSVAVKDEEIVGYATFHPPGELETWGDDRTGKLIELGAVEVDPACRGERLASRLLESSFASGRFDDTIVFATMYAWHYDLKGTGLSDFAYKRMLERLYKGAGLEVFATSDPEVRSDAANGLMARIGPNCPSEVRAEFDRLRLRRQPIQGF